MFAPRVGILAALSLASTLILSGCYHQAAMDLAVRNEAGEATTLKVIVKTVRSGVVFEKTYPLEGSRNVTKVDTLELPADAYILNATAGSRHYEAQRSLSGDIHTWTIFIRSDRIEFGFGR